ncbi:MAG: hypothetical protein U1E05_21220, partial [Patescibacteria group bacterium]|nr:hypothetical protein [Patescibacteria group bacterium]
AVGREMAGLAFLAAYLGGIPYLLARTGLRSVRANMGGARYWTMMLIGLPLIILPLKMVLRWTMGISHIVSMPEFQLNL